MNRFILPVLILAAALMGGAGTARADNACVAEYETAAMPYWRIATDMAMFKAMFDDYDRLCTAHYPDEIAALQPDADRLRNQVDADIKSTRRVMSDIFADVLPKDVSPICAKDKTARNRVRKNLLTALDRQSDSTQARLRKSSTTLQDPKDNLKLCTDLKKLKPRITKALGPGLSNPLLEMTELHSRMITRDLKTRKDAFRMWRAAIDHQKKNP